jgi:hypothetical protein
VRLTRAPLTVWSVLSRILIGVVGVAGAAVVGVPGIAAAAAEYAAELPHGQLRHRRIRDDLLNSADQSGFVLSPEGSYTFG